MAIQDPNVQANQLWEFAVLGEDEQQAVINIFHYWAPDNLVETMKVSEALTECRLRWRTGFQSIQSAFARVLTYELREITGIRAGGPIEDPTRNKWPEYGHQAILEGEGAADTGAVAGEATPTFVAVSYRKVTVTRKKYFRGGTRIGPLGEGSTNAVTGNGHNVFTDDAQSDHKESAEPHVTHITAPGGGSIMVPVVYSRTLHYQNKEAGSNEMWTSEIAAYVASPFVSSQVSRKQNYRLN